MKTCTSTLALVKVAVPVSVTLTCMDVPVPRATLDGVAVAEEENVSDEFTVMLPAELLELQACPVALRTVTCRVKVPEAAGVNVRLYCRFWLAEKFWPVKFCDAAVFPPGSATKI